MANPIKLFLKLLPLINRPEWRAKIIELTSQFAPLIAVLDSVPLPQCILESEDIQFIESFSIEDNADKAIKLFEAVLAKQVTLEISLLHPCEYYLDKYKSLEAWRESIELSLKMNIINFIMYKELPRISITVSPLVNVISSYSNLSNITPEITKIIFSVIL